MGTNVTAHCSFSEGGHVDWIDALSWCDAKQWPAGLDMPTHSLTPYASGAAPARACRYLEFLRAVSPALALVHAEKQHVPARAQDASCVCRLMCRVADAVFPGVGVLRSHLRQGAARRREGPVAAPAALAECMRAAVDRCGDRHGTRSHALFFSIAPGLEARCCACGGARPSHACDRCTHALGQGRRHIRQQ